MTTARNTVMTALLSVLIFTQCARGVREMEAGPADARKSIMIAALSSEYKNRIAEGLAEHYKNRTKVTVVPIEKLNSVDHRKYDALVIIDALLAWQMFNVRTRSFIGDIKDPVDLKKIVLFFTAGKPSENYSVMGVDCITGASTMNTDDEVIRRISERIDGILKK
jgi:hypothetical protein